VLVKRVGKMPLAVHTAIRQNLNLNTTMICWRNGKIILAHQKNNERVIAMTPPIGISREKDTVGYINIQVDDENNPPVVALLLTRGQVALLKFWFQSHHAEGRDGDMDMKIYLALCNF
jgi:hypothetical protein